MIDVQILRDQPDLIKTTCHNKNVSVTDADIDRLLVLDREMRDLMSGIETTRRERNELAAGAKGERPSEHQVEKGKTLKNELTASEEKYALLEGEFTPLFRRLPNIVLADVPVGATEQENVVSKTWGDVPGFDFEIRSHWELAEARGWIDKERAAKVAGARFAYVKGELARLHFALVMFGMDTLGDENVLRRIAEDAGLNVSTKPFIPVMPPALIRTEVYEATGRLNAQEDTYRLEDDDLWLNASAEHSLAPMHMNEIIDEKQLPLRYLGYATSFRREAGSYGRDMEGIFRLHQFDKLEMESFTTAENSLDEHLFMIAIQEYLMQQLRLPYRVILKCTADVGKPNARGVDIDAWLPSQNNYRETHTADLITDYQTRRLQTRVRRSGGEVELAHTNDATAFSQRPLIAILENYQKADGSVKVPKVLQKYFGKEVM